MAMIVDRIENDKPHIIKLKIIAIDITCITDRSSMMDRM